ncbi:aldehyde dehydrogenase family protein [Polaribacter sargassicola]|uniref:aldehyde dehydrogenase family protein n=1 Tax=Polaribacter sargassicola TaxID=2836891 RepID=UPI001F3D9AB7|nr:aldehyde dehydrogenase family protein [Polaribacter sp. DS7-9]MCG1037018.1 aldehyde dehydrogenase family protein [Polaribacter sp. DS7-9]
MEQLKDTLNLEAITAIFNAQKENQFAVANQPIKERKKKLIALKKAVAITYRKAIAEALYKDMRKPKAEVDLTEIYPITSEIKHTIKHLNSWTDNDKVSTPFAFFGTTSYIKYEPKGVCLIISPWNFPVNLTFAPLISAIAAGNTVILKPSEMTPHISKVMKTIVSSIFKENEVVLIEGAVQTSTDLLSLPFNHIFFTGSPAIGKVVMSAAAKHLTSVTLELGGKSPTIVDETANIKTTAKRIAVGKFTNAGQICIAPDYIYVHKSKEKELIEEFKKVLKAFYENDANESDSYSCIVNKNHKNRLSGIIKDAIEHGASISYGGKINDETNVIEPTILTNVNMGSKVMQEEIFGPILPIITFTEIDEVIDTINQKEKPLALYVYSSKKKNIKYILNNTRAGGSCINNNAIHFYNNNLPFGGSNNSGIGKSHGFFGFQEFSNARGVLKQFMPGALDLLAPPYTNLKEKIINFTIKWL